VTVLSPDLLEETLLKRFHQGFPQILLTMGVAFILSRPA
jgi:hypothetical protein